MTRDSGATYEATTRSMPWLVGSYTPVIALVGMEGSILLTRVQVLAPPPLPPAPSAPEAA